MPYKDPERKRQWEREHREQRNAQRRQIRQYAQMGSGTILGRPDPMPVPEPESTWKKVFSWVVTIAFVLLKVGNLCDALKSSSKR